MRILTKRIFLCSALLLLAGVMGYFYGSARLGLSSLKSAIHLDKLPKHVAVMMDGNGRWATKQGKARVFGHQNSLQSLKELIEGCIELGIPHLTLYAFSTENWARPQEEVQVLMDLFTHTLQRELPQFIDYNIKLSVIGEVERLPQHCREAIQQAIATTQSHQGLHLTVALSYSGRWDITQAAKALAQDVANKRIKPADIDVKVFERYLSTQGLPDPDLLIRTGGEMRISNFLLWQIAYTELVVIPTYWPDFRKKHLYQAIMSYQARERRFGKIQT